MPIKSHCSHIAAKFNAKGLLAIASLTAMVLAPSVNAQSLKTYQGRYASFSYPSDWVLTAPNDQNVSVAPKDGSNHEFSIFITTAYGSNLTNFFNDVENALQQQAASIQGSTCSVTWEPPNLNGQVAAILTAYFSCEAQLGDLPVTFDELVEAQSSQGTIAAIVTLFPSDEEWPITNGDTSNQLAAIRKSLVLTIGNPSVAGTWKTAQISDSEVGDVYVSLRTYQGTFTFAANGSFSYVVNESAQTDVAPWVLTVKGSYTFSAASLTAGPQTATLTLTPSSASMNYVSSGTSLSDKQETLELTRLADAGFPGTQGATYQMTWNDQNSAWDMKDGGIEVVVTGGSSVPITPPPTTTPLAGSLRFVPMTPCRVLDTRNAAGSFGGPEIAAASPRELDIPKSACGVPSNAAAYSLNVTVVPSGGLGYLSIWPSGQSQPSTSVLNSDGRVKANAAVVPAGTNGGINIYASDATHAIVDIDGYFASTTDAPQGLAFYPLTPCRVADTRNPAGSLGGPYLAGGTARSFPVLASACHVPSLAQAYSLNFTVVPHQPLGFLAAWPSGQGQPLASVLNASTGSVTANAALIPAGSNGEITAFASNDSDVVIDINGYFATPASGGLLLYTVVPCRVLDTRNSGGAPFTNTLPIAVGGRCGVPDAAQAFVLNATVIPDGLLGYLSLWPDGQAKPLVSTLNADWKTVTSNAAIVPSVNGSVDAYASQSTHLVLDISSYFAP